MPTRFILVVVPVSSLEGEVSWMIEAAFSTKRRFAQPMATPG
jgi:hypothetical protein